MSLYSALYAGVSGLSAQSSAMATVADNITNINTVAYKGVEAQFRTLVTDGRASSSYAAGGVAATPITQVTKQGLPQATGSSTDLAIDGDGFFITRAGVTGNDAVAYTRAGSFKPDEQGFMRNSSGLYLYGWRLDATGDYTNTGSIDALTPVRLSDLVGTAAPTTAIDARINLQSDATTYTGAYTAGDLATNTVAPTFTRSFTVYDSQGGNHELKMSFLKTGANTWKAETYMNPAGDVTATNGLLASGEIKFNGDGSLDKAGSTGTFFDTLNISYTNGSSSVPITMSLGEDGGISGLTSFGQPSSLVRGGADGGILGNIAATEISKDGVVSAIFDDGSSRKVFQLPVATFPNPNGLTRISGNAYSGNRQSGMMTMNAPGELGAGSLLSNTLEASTVDLAGEFTNMIRFQRAYSASSKIITTVDDMLREVSDLKR
ncbi:Flagellar hook protein FlgE [Sphingomonas sp. S2M10]|uniref:flagellar hook protein FlgE n=1 Tax=Sphingomonas sp. S2M10 TaxID=2705010 RepID=UPI0014566ADF|nr:flagellar hook protein FlgE [Sphingomonas sp. S2M10]NLS27269.1 Flagellar hook protein FlgE [Sphingomonas sp. S2M10]